MPAQKDAHLNVRLTAAERATIASRARAAGLSSSAYVRRRALMDDTRPVIKVDTEQLRALYRTLRLSASNLNQCTRELNTHHRPDQVEQRLSETLESLVSATSEVAEFIAIARKSI